MTIQQDIATKATAARTLIDEIVALAERLNDSTLPQSDFSYGPALLEKAATNLCFPSNLVGWSTTNATLTADSGGVRITETTGNGFHEAYKAITIGSGPHCHSAEVKAVTASKGRIWFVNASIGFYADFDLAAGTITPASNFGGSTPHQSFITPLGDGWFRVGVSGTVSVSTGYIDVALRESGVQYAGTGKAMLVRNAQSEAGYFPTSHIPTTTATVTRPNSFNVTTLQPFAETTIVLHARSPIAWPTDYAVLLHIDNNVDSVFYNDLEAFIDATGKLTARATKDMYTKNDIDLGVIQPNTDFKVALTASVNGLRASLNGGAVQSVAIPSWPADFIRRRLGTQLQGIREWNGVLYKAEQWFSTATDAQLQALAAMQ